MEEKRKKANKFIYKTFLSDYQNNDALDFFGNEFEKIANKAYADMINAKFPSKNPFLIRLGGQSGSGKTTQLMPAIQENLIERENSYVHLAVRKFAEYHPYYDEITKNFDKSLWREKTNGFALTLLFAVCEKLIENKYNIFFEVTLLDPDFEEYLILLAKNNGYKMHFSILSVPQEISNSWILERQLTDGVEGNRVVLKTSSDYFYSILPKAIEKIISLKVFDKNDSFIIWSAFEKDPILVSNDFNENILEIFKKNRENQKKYNISKENLLKAKIKFYKNYFK